MLTTILTTLLTITTIITLKMTIFPRKNKFQISGLTAVVTGGSQGLGLSVAKLLAKKGANVVIVAQTVSKLESALSEIEAVTSSSSSNQSQRHMYLSYDLRSPDSAGKIIEKIEGWSGAPPDVVFNCAGNCLPGFFASSDVEQHRVQMETVYWTSAYMAHATLNSWIKPGGKPRPMRHLVFTSSVLAFLPMAGYASYNPAKAAMRSLADTLNQEVAVYNGARGTADGPSAEIKVHIAFPMGILSPGYENEQKTKPQLTQSLEEDDKPQNPDELAEILISGLEAGQYMLTASPIGHIMRGWAMGASQRTSLSDYFWAFIGSIVVLFIAPDFMSKCHRWGKTKGLKGTN